MSKRDQGDRKKLTLQEAADSLGVHYMTVYKYVRTGRLAATKDGVEWKVDAADVTALKKAQKATKAPPRSGTPRGRALPRLQERLVAGDEAGAWTIIADALSSGAGPQEIYLELIVPAMRWVGDRWESRDLSVADEHRAAAVAQRLVGRLGPRFVRRGRRKGTIVVGAPTMELHSLPVSVVADLLRVENYEVIELGPNTPPESFVDAARSAQRLIAVAMCITTSVAEEGLTNAIAALRNEGIEVPILVGGAAVRDTDHAEQMGATGYTGSDATSALAAVRALKKS